jgi:NADPH-dependent glutamate synthase beta subunit-like oxidoreductase
MSEPEQYAIAIVGGATAGAEAASIFSAHDILTVVFEQNDRPYGKIEDGLPRWHHGLRHKEYDVIDSKLVRPHVHFVPRTRLSRDVSLSELADDWGFHSVVLAHGAWRDRPLAVEGADAWVGRGLVYQNPFIYWFNHYQESDYAGEQFEILDGTVVVGGGLASIDVVKALQLELVVRALAERGIEQDLIELEVKGIPKTLEAHGLRWDELGIQGCTLYYRRRPEDMPLVDLPDGANDKVRERVAGARKRVLDKAMEKYLFEMQSQHVPVDLIVEGDRLVGLVFARTLVKDGRVERTDETVEVRGPQVISSIGSVPEALDGIPMKGELYAFDDWETGRIHEYPTLFSVGNVVTGKGNIVASRKHARGVSQQMLDEYFRLADAVKALDPLPEGKRDEILARVRVHQERAGYAGDYKAWIESVTPPDFA